MYDVNTYRGCGGVGIWDGKELHVSRNWRTESIYANGPVRAVFDLGFEPWDAGDVGGIGNGVMVSETKRFIVDAGHNLDEIDSTFTFKGSRQSDGGELTVAIGLTTHPGKAALIAGRRMRPAAGWGSGKITRRRGTAASAPASSWLRAPASPASWRRPTTGFCS